MPNALPAARSVERTAARQRGDAPVIAQRLSEARRGNEDDDADAVADARRTRMSRSEINGAGERYVNRGNEQSGKRKCGKESA